MLLTITTTHTPADDLGYLLYKQPERVQQFSLTFGTAHEAVFGILVLESEPVDPRL